MLEILAQITEKYMDTEYSKNLWLNSKLGIQ